MKQSQVTGAVLTGAAVGMAVGATAYWMTGHAKKKGMTMLKKNAGKALRAVGGALENASYLMK